MHAGHRHEDAPLGEQFDHQPAHPWASRQPGLHHDVAHLADLVTGSIEHLQTLQAADEYRGRIAHAA